MGLYTSPHLERVEERIVLDGQNCPRETLAELIRQVQPAVAALDLQARAAADGAHGPTYFEILTALAFCYFAQQKVDFAVLEVGLGGRLDSTNVCLPLVTAITSISLDHMQQLGNTLAAIAGEKAGIIKQGVPVVSGVVEQEPRDVIASVAGDHDARLVQLGRDFDFAYHPPRHLDSEPAQGSVDFVDLSQPADRHPRRYPLGLLGRHQGANAAVAIAVLTELTHQGWAIPDTALQTGLAEVRWPARLEILRRQPTVLLDAAHNVASVAALLRAIDESFARGRRRLIFATSRDKDFRGMLQWLLPAFDEAILTRYTTNPRGAPLEELEECARALGAQNVRACADPAEAWQAVCETVAPQDLVVITGSFFIAGEMRAIIRERR